LVLLLLLAMAGFIAYTLYFNKQYNLFDASGRFKGFSAASTKAPVVTSENTSQGVSNATGSTGSEASASNAASSGGGVAESGAGNQKGALITDSVPNIIGSSAAAPVTKQKQAAV